MPEVDTAEVIWSNTDYPYICLIDKQRTLGFKEAISALVKPGDTVVEIGAGSGILSLFAVSAGAAKVFAVEIDPILADALRKTVVLNGMQDSIEVIEGDALEVDLPQNVDMVIAEIIETGLLDEMQVTVMNQLRDRGIIGVDTKLIPQGYETSLQLVQLDNSFYGYKIAAPIHNWPYYAKDASEWEQISVQDASEPQIIGTYNFENGLVTPHVEADICFDVFPGMTPNALKLSGVAHMTTDQRLGACNSFSGDKLLLTDLEVVNSQVKLRVSYDMGQGFRTWRVTQP